MFVAVLAPLLLGGCVLPLSVQIASFFADGLSLMTTDKTLSDHGLSALTNQDCAVWRILDDEEICRDSEPDDGAFMVADGNPDETVAADVHPWLPVEESHALVDADDMADIRAASPATAQPSVRLVDADDVNLTVTPEIEVARLESMVEPDVPLSAPADEYDLTVPDPPSAEYTPVSEPVLASVPAAAAAPKIGGGTFLIIASYYRISDAGRFQRRHAVHETRVLAGTASGKTVYRVAVGPIGKAQRATVRAKLVGAGFDDVWTLSLKAPKFVVEVAALSE